MANVRVFPPASGATFTTPRGTVYTTTTYLDVPDFDAELLTSNGWVPLGVNCCGVVGPTSARPVSPPGGSMYDTTVGTVITWVSALVSPGNLAGRWVDTGGNTV